MKTASSILRDPWNLLVLLVVFSIFFMWPTWVSFHNYWLASTRYSHGHLIVLISLYLLYRQKPAIESSAARPFWPAIPVFGLLLFVWLIAVLASVQAIQQVLTPLMLWFLCLAVLGWRLARWLVLAFAYLYLAVPVWEGGNFVLQLLTVKAVEFALLVANIPAFIEGNFVNLPAGSFEIAGGCSGLHYFIIAIAISILYSALYLRTLGRRVLLVTLAVLMALLTNWVRVFVVVFAGHVTDMQHYLVTHDHYYFGWVLFVLAMIPFAIIARRLEGADGNPGETRKPDTTSEAQAGRPRIFAALSACFLLFAASSATLYAKIPAISQDHVLLELPRAVGGWVAEDSIQSDWRPYFEGPVGEAFGSYRDGDRLVDLYVNLYRDQAQGRELVGYENHVEGLAGWTMASSKVRTIGIGRDDVRPVREARLTSASQSMRLVYFWYEVDGKCIAGDLEAKLYYGLRLLRGRPDAGITVVSTRCAESCDNARLVLQDWIDAYASALQVSC